MRGYRGLQGVTLRGVTGGNRSWQKKKLKRILSRKSDTHPDSKSLLGDMVLFWQ